jgi:hypothetical protein
MSYDYGINRSSGPTADTNWHVLKIDNNAWTIDGVTRTAPTTGAPTSPYTIYFGNINAKNEFAQGRFFTGNIKYFRIYKNDILVKDLTPSIRAVDGVCGVYDKITGIFVSNIGAGNITCSDPVVKTCL